jgi:hypothetical protein
MTAQRMCGSGSVSRQIDLDANPGSREPSLAVHPYIEGRVSDIIVHPQRT